MPPLNPPARHPDLTPEDKNVYIVTNPKTAAKRQAQILQRRAGGEAYVHFLNTDRRLDEWVPESQLRVAEPHEITKPIEIRGKKRKRMPSHYLGSPSTSQNGAHAGSQDGVGHSGRSATPAASESEEDSDTGEHLRLTAKRNFDRVNFGHWQIKTWYFSPYPVSESEQDEGSAPTSSDPFKAARAADRQRQMGGLPRSTLRAHGRTADLVAGGLGRNSNAVPSGYTTLWVCDRCFKYMREGVQWELHTKNCKWTHPPGRKVYERGAHVIWEVDGAEQKLYCQNLSLFGKLFIDIKTLFFDTENFMFYLLTDADSQRDHVLGFFSKEKVSYDNYNLACIVTLPPYQRKGYGMLLIEFSYELSRRAGVLGTPERPLSDLGLRSYVTFWISVLVRFFRRVLTVGIPEVARFTGIPVEAMMMDGTDGTRRKKRFGGGVPELTKQPPAGPLHSTESASPVPHVHLCRTLRTPHSLPAPFFESFRRMHTFANADGSATTHIVVSCTLDDISKATALRPEDAAFALKECGLLQRRKKRDSEQLEDMICVSREMVEAVAKARGVKKNMMELNHVLL
ncbi:acyl-CoA N-acyltransferase [Ramaria rubella]|nr:acyl-CoA N-acyltransferase [Ramaria rubella]